MTTVAVSRREDAITEIVIVGHAGYDVEGRDIVCAAVSILATTCVNSLESVAGVRAKISQNEKTARIRIRLPENMPPQQAHDAQVVLATILRGFEDIASAYPDYLDLNDERSSS